MTDKKQTRETLTAKISTESARGWKDFCNSNGISLTAMIEVAGLELAQETNPPTVQARISMIEKARAIDIARRSRK